MSGQRYTSKSIRVHLPTSLIFIHSAHTEPGVYHLISAANQRVCVLSVVLQQKHNSIWLTASCKCLQFASHYANALALQSWFKCIQFVYIMFLLISSLIKVAQLSVLPLQTIHKMFHFWKTIISIVFFLMNFSSSETETESESYAIRVETIPRYPPSQLRYIECVSMMNAAKLVM